MHKKSKYITNVNKWFYFITAILFSSCRTFSYENISGEYVMDFSNEYFEIKWSIILDESGDFVLTEPRIGLLGPDTLSGKYTIAGNKMILDFGNANQYQYKPELGDSVTILHFYDKKTTKPQVCLIEIYGPLGKESFTTNIAENDTIIGSFDSIVCSSLLTDSIVIYPTHIGYEMNIYLFQGEFPFNSSGWVLSKWRICSRNKLCDPNRLFVRKKRNIYKRAPL
jgi:hypothetical protein